MTGPTREEVEAGKEAVWRESPHCDRSTCRAEIDGPCPACWEEEVRAILLAAEPFMRARHVREAVEGLKRSRTLDDALRRYDEERYGEAMGAAGADPRTAWEEVIAALLAALTGEGK